MYYAHMVIDRILTKQLQADTKSSLLLGPRQTGKSTLLRSLSPDLAINLADEQTFVDFSANPGRLTQLCTASVPRLVLLDEVQRLPSLLNTVQVLLDESRHPVRFLLSGSSARKLRRGQANLLPGRIHTYHLGPLCAGELDYRCNTEQALCTGTLPGIYLDTSPESRLKTLRSYTATYLKEEIQAEALTRNLEGFSRFLFYVATCAGQTVDFTKIASEAQIQRQSATRYFEILEDTLLITRCEAFAKSTRKRLVLHPKFYFFDVGVFNALVGNFLATPDRIGVLFEHLLCSQLAASLMAHDHDFRLSTYRTTHGAEVDLIAEFGGTVWAIEVKASRTVGSHDLRGLRDFAAYYGRPCHRVVAYLGEQALRMEDIDILPWQQFLRTMGL